MFICSNNPFRPMKGNPDSVMQKIFACRIRNPGLWNPESRTLKSGTWTVESGVRLKESYRASRGPFFPIYLERSKGFCSQGKGIRNPTDDWKSKFHQEKIRNPVPDIRNPRPNPGLHFNLGFFIFIKSTLSDNFLYSF